MRTIPCKHRGWIPFFSLGLFITISYLATSQEPLPSPLNTKPPPERSDQPPDKPNVDLLQEQIDTLQKRLNLLIEYQSEAVDELDRRTLQSKRNEAALRNEIDDTREMIDADRRDQAYNRNPTREFFNTFRNNQSPFWFGGTLAGGFTDLDRRSATFQAETLSPHFYLLLNERFLIESNPEITAGGEVDLESAQLDYFINDHWTFVFGRFYSPVGFMNERLHTSWIYKTPDKPIMFSQVFPSTTSLQGFQLRGARYVAHLPLKAEYAFFAANGYSTNEDLSEPGVTANLRAMDALGVDVNNDKAFGTRLGIQCPMTGWISGISYMHNGAYDRSNQFGLQLVDVDASLRQGNWDFAFEMAKVFQEAPIDPIRRFGMYAQVAYRDFQSRHPIVEKLEYVGRYERTDFEGISAADARATNAIDRNRYSVGGNYYPYPSLVFKLHYIFDDEDSRLSTQGLYFNLALGF